MEYLIRFIQMHETFRKPETDSLADLNGFKLEWLSYSDDVGTQHGKEKGECVKYMPSMVSCNVCCSSMFTEDWARP